jgi:membrane protease YdiL (CAAX protease family)
MSGTAFDPLAICLLVVLTLVAPIVGVWDYRRFLRRVREGHARARFNAYLWTIAVEWVSTAGFLAWWLLSGGTLAPLRLVPTANGLQWLAISAGLAIVALAIVQMAIVLRSPEKLEQVRRQSGELSAITPHTTAEQRAFAWVSITAGVCEETMYRGLLLAVLSAALGLWPAVVLSTVVFGLGHAYQGWMGILKTAAAGLVLALLAVGTGSLFIPMLLHAVGDFTSGRMMHAAWRSALPSYGTAPPKTA